MVSCVRLTSCINRTMSEDRAIGDIKICATFIRTDVGVISIVITSTVRSAYSQNQLFVATFRDRFWDSALRKAKSGAAVTGSYSKTESRERIPVTYAWRHYLVIAWAPPFIPFSEAIFTFHFFAYLIPWLTNRGWYHSLRLGGSRWVPLLSHTWTCSVYRLIRQCRIAS